MIYLSGFAYLLFVEDLALRQETLATCNTWLADTCAEAHGRLLPVTALDYHDLGWAVAELTRMRARGSRLFLVPAYPVNGVPPSHASWDRVWSTATDLGMVAMLHTGFERMRFDPGWANQSGDTTLLRQIGSSHRHVAPMTLLYALIYGGVFERHPTLTLLLAEVGTGWLPFVHREIDDRTTPLAGGNDSPLARIMDDLPEDMIVFSSDFPHFEGFGEPRAHYDELLATLPEVRRARFLGGSIADVYRRMGDPLPLA